ncbi:N-acetylglucosaminyl transferase component-domain-containing protein [Cantharellus anzutake]|uniref:N-acetylglucosaminyl transferase component-domain-containing protein n=1 Tax=Cantharellus anzutake TaxID=1750568 RepID=UPI0019059F69|nr:N-acetylglucosaminyl transferase component-domain-containing protein [Cantharellus anzutake]KAF8332033.1 N-acetylglucosaminyl transferase component-domain-containing protein [Cantharellus anzutake]
MSSMRFLSLEPLPLDIASKKSEYPETHNLSKNYLALSDLDFTNPRLTAPRATSHILDEINASPLNRTIKNAPLSKGPSLLTQTSFSASIGTTIKFILGLCNLQIPYVGEATRMKDLSATLQQFDVRGEQALLLPKQSLVLQRREQEDLAFAAAQYISFYNCIWLVINDIIIGAAFGKFLRDNCEPLAELLSYYAQRYVVEDVRNTLIWLDSWPVGLKLNTQLSRFFCVSFMGIGDIWGNFLHAVAPSLPWAIFGIGCMGLLGMTMIFSLLSDTLSIFTGSLYFCYLVSTKIFSAQLVVLGSLFNLFRGKRRNVLRNRTDSWDYDIDQLMLGTILFTLVTFLFPTVLVYYLLFALCRLGIIMIHACLETALAFMNHFPLFATILRFKDPARLPGGVYLVLSPGPPPRLVPKNSPVPFSQIFFQHLRVWSKLSQHYSPLRLLRCVVAGILIMPIPRYSIRYDMVGIEERTKKDE